MNRVSENILYLKEFEKFIKELSDKSAKVILQYFRKKTDIHIKKDGSPVTLADKKAEEVIRDLIMRKFPQHGIIGEEFGNYKEDSDHVWVLDPIDGTKSFICGAVTFGTLISLTHKKKPVLGAFYQPVLDQFLIGNNETAKLNGEKTKVSQIKNLSRARLLTTDVFSIKKFQKEKPFENLVKQVGYFRGLGDCYGYYLLATGFAEIMIDPILSIWDSMALIPIIRGAGGVVSDYHGNENMKMNSLVASVPGMHKKVISILNG